MKEVFEKIIGRLEQLLNNFGEHCEEWGGECRHKSCSDCVLSHAIEIVDQVADEFADDTNVGHKSEIPTSSEYKLHETVDKFFSHNEVVALWKKEKDEISYHKLLWRGMAWDIPKEYKTCRFVKIFGTIPESIAEADTINIEVEYD